MLIFSPADLNRYELHDSINQALKASAQQSDANFTSHRWLQESLPKRMIFSHVYGELLASQENAQSILDVGGGFTSLTRVLIRKHRYYLLDLMAHDSFESVYQEEKTLEKNFWINKDWLEFDPSAGFDVVIANDLFPNVDQRLELFLERYLPHCREMRLTLTYYNHLRWYKVRRVDADEVFHILAWDGARLRRALEPYVDRIDAPDFEGLVQDCPSLFPNQRQVCLVKLRGDA